MGFNLKRNPQPIPRINHPRIFSWPYQNTIARGGKLFEQRPRIFVTTMLRPHDPKHSQFCSVWMTTQAIDNHLIFIGFETFGGNLLGRTGGKCRHGNPRVSLQKSSKRPYLKTLWLST